MPYIYKLRFLMTLAAIATSLRLLFGICSPHPPSAAASPLAHTDMGTTYSSTDTRKLAYMTSLTNTTNNDFQFTATRMLGYQLLHQATTKTQRRIPFVVLVTTDVIQETRDLLIADGAVVIPVSDLYNTSSFRPDNNTSFLGSGTDTALKAAAWTLTSYDLIAFLDANVVLNRCMDAIFDDTAVASQTTLLGHHDSTLPKNYIFAALPEVNAIHDYPPATKDFANLDTLSSAVYLFRPDIRLFRYFVNVLSTPQQLLPSSPSGQQLLNHAFNRKDNMPWRQLDQRWHIKFPHPRDVEGGVASMYIDSWWYEHMHTQLRTYYDSIMWRMQGFYELRG
ncbi:unnamed protein product [Aureobasidium uvarum]|uniref:Nucleotide-diphospho-sugar transferase n=1 Tax=Aureobasidium uvarum TaxID=2773716 RepID=A0A9N8PPA2_9PEZI|nr:unnamed protein product [Aureobasidium uvarum]